MSEVKVNRKQLVGGDGFLTEMLTDLNDFGIEKTTEAIDEI